MIKLFFLLLWIIVVITWAELGEPPVVDIRNKLSPLNFMLYAVLFGPFLEEAIFRLSLVFKPLYITISVYQHATQVYETKCIKARSSQLENFLKTIVKLKLNRGGRVRNIRCVIQPGGVR